jgi:diguanylate cyclase (GGDEF)-like protein
MLAPTLRRLDPLELHLALVTGAGLGLAVAFALRDGHDVLSQASASLWLFAAFVIVGELLPIRIPGRSDDEFTVSTSFAFALLLTAGAPAAVLVQVIGSLLGDRRQRKPLRVALFNASQYAIALTLSGLVLDRVAGIPAPEPPYFGPDAIPAVLLGALVFFGVNQTLAGTVQALAAGRGLSASLWPDLRCHAMTAATLLALAPLVVVAAGFSPALIPLLALPLWAVYRGGRQALLNEHQALHDWLTGLPNRALLRDRIQQGVLACRRDGQCGAVMLLDLDRFKDVNDNLGHRYGDLLLQQVGPRLRDAVRESDTVARLGGDEFAMLLPGVGEDAVAQVAAKIVEALERPFVVDGATIDVGASVGAACYPGHGDDVDTLLQHADTAMYLAKEAGSGWELYDRQHEGRRSGKLALAAELRRALERGELVLHYQPKADLHSGRVTSVEALVRWQHPARGVLGPMEFIPVAEQTGLIGPLTRWVLGEALGQCAAWRDQGLDLSVAVNLSARNLLDSRLPDDVAGMLGRNRLGAASLELEITEGAIMTDPVRARTVLERLSTMGIRLAIDDFGVGHSSLAYLGRLPVDEIKIDRSFVMGMGEDRGDAVIVRSTIDLGRNLGLEVVAEGVETNEAWEQLAKLGCDRAQGYFLTRPLPASDVACWIAEWHRGGSPVSSLAAAS